MKTLIRLRDEWFGDTPHMRKRSYGLLPFILVFAAADIIAEAMLIVSPEPTITSRNLRETSVWRYLAREARR